MCHTVTDKPHHILTPRYPNICLIYTTKLDIWLSNIETSVDILKWRHTCLSEATSHGLTFTHVLEVLQAGKCWDITWDILHLKLCNVGIHTYTMSFMEIPQSDNEILAAYVHCFKMEAKKFDFNSDTATIYILTKGLWDAHNITAKVYEKDPQTLLEVINWWRSSAWHKRLQLPCHCYDEYGVR